MSASTPIQPEAAIAGLRRKVEETMSEHVTPSVKAAADRAEAVVSRVAGEAEQVAQRVGDASRRELDMWTDRIRERPLMSVAIAAGVGFLLSRLFAR
jgi:ElaB/YqjD/DUF883 family membrane-anchored ribosome-binding protein